MTFVTGRYLGKYEIQAEIGRGGMGTVYAAYDAMLQRQVAIKVLRRELTIDPEFVARFHQEAVAAASLHHPGIVTIYDVGQEEDVHYIVMQFLLGTTLHEWLAARGPLPAADAEPIVTQLGAALDHAHQHGIIHRDLKPSNIMLSPDGQPTLMDFGLVRAGEASGLTHSGIVIGTPEYMAPEQALGEPVDARTDIYAFGIVIYRLLTGKVPFARSTSMATAYAHVHEPPPSLRQIRPEVPRSVERVVLKALAKLPAERYQSAGQLAADFAQAATGKVPTVLRTLLVRSGTAASTTSMARPGPTPTSPATGAAMGDASTQMQPPTPTGSNAAVATPAAARSRTRRPWGLVATGAAILAVLLFVWVATRPPSLSVMPTVASTATVTGNRLVAPLTMTPTATQSPTATATPSATTTRVTPSTTPTPTVTVTPSSTVTPTPSPTATSIVTQRPAPPTSTRAPLPPTPTPTLTDTPVPPPTDTPEPPIDTPEPPPTNTPEPPTNTPEPPPTNTPEPPTNTPVPEPTNTPAP